MARSILNRRWPWLTAAALVVVAYLSTFVEIEFAVGDPRPIGTADDIAALESRSDLNVLFILIDTLRADRLSAYGYERKTSPILDELAASGVVFQRNLAQSSWTKCSMASLWTGVYPQRTGVTRFEHVLSADARMPAEILREAGFRTAGLFRNGWVEGYFGFAQGFEVYDRPVGLPPPPSVRRENPTVSIGGTDVHAVDGAVEFLRVYGRERWFLYLHLMDVHEYVYDEDTAVFGTDFSDVYDNAILRLNLTLNQLLRHMREKGYLENTLIVIASDHGEAFGERGFEGHARKVYRESTEVPLILAFPFRLEPGIVIEQRTRNVDLWPTVLELLGLPALEGTDGRSRVPEIMAAARGESPPPEADPSYAHLDQVWGRDVKRAAPTVAVARGPYRYVLETRFQGRDVESLFDAGGDPGELDNVIAERAEVADEMRALARSYLESPPVSWGSETQALELDEIQLNQLRALGYAVP